MKKYFQWLSISHSFINPFTHHPLNEHSVCQPVCIPGIHSQVPVVVQLISKIKFLRSVLLVSPIPTVISTSFSLSPGIKAGKDILSILLFQLGLVGNVAHFSLWDLSRSLLLDFWQIFAFLMRRTDIYWDFDHFFCHKRWCLTSFNYKDASNVLRLSEPKYGKMSGILVALLWT